MRASSPCNGYVHVLTAADFTSTQYLIVSALLVYKVG